jgi:hypothetical protein
VIEVGPRDRLEAAFFVAAQDEMKGKSDLTITPFVVWNGSGNSLFSGTAMALVTRTTDGKARVRLPIAFANTTVLIEQVSETEVRIRMAQVIPEDERLFAEERNTPLSDRDRDLFLALLDNPPPANAALKKAAENSRRSRG